MKVTAFPRTTGGCDYYRVSLPLSKAAKAGSFHLASIMADRVASDMVIHPERFADYINADVICFPRPAELSFMTALRKRNHRAKIVVDYDDDVFNLSPMNAHYVDYGTEDVKIQMPGGRIQDLWKDGVNIDLARNRERMDNVRWCLENADLVTVTTDILAARFRQYNDKIAVLPNCVDLTRFYPLALEKKEIRLFWAGGWSHYEDWFQIKDAIREVMQKHSNVKLVLMGYMWESTLQGVPKDRIEFHDWEETVSYPLKLSILNPDIAVIPLRDTHFNQAKSPIKWLEMAALKVPSVSSYIPPYAPIAELSDDNGIYIENNDRDGWIEGVSLLIDDESRRKAIGERAYQTVQKHFDINTQYHQWVNAFQEVLCQFPKTLQPAN